MEIIIVFIFLGLLYLIFKPSAKRKSKKQKQAEIIASYKRKLDYGLSGIEDRTLLLQKKIVLLKSYSEELNRNLFFDEEEVRELIQKLAKYEANGGN